MLVGNGLCFLVYVQSSPKGTQAESCAPFLCFVKFCAQNKFTFPFLYYHLADRLCFRCSKKSLVNLSAITRVENYWRCFNKKPQFTRPLMNAWITTLLLHFSSHTLLHENAVISFLGISTDSGHPVENTSPYCLSASVHYSYTHTQNTHLPYF